MTTNLYRNPKFDTLTDWLWTAADATTAREEGQTHDWGAPGVTAEAEMVIIERHWGPFWAALYQQVSGLTIGATYKIAWDITATMRHPEQNPMPAGDAISAEARIKTGQGVGPWHDGSVLKYGQKVNISGTLIPGAVTDSLGVEVRARHSLWQNRFTLSNPVLELVAPSPNAPGGQPTETPASPTLIKVADIRRRLIALSSQSMVMASDLEAMRYQIQNLEIELAALESLLSLLIAAA